MAIVVLVSTAYSIDETALSSARLARAAQFRNEEDRARCLCAGVALDTALRTVGLREKTVRIEKNKYGKPFLIDHPEHHFSLSHSGDYAVCALSDAPIGVDIEQCRPRSFLSLAERYFTPDECERLRALSTNDRTTAFYRLWTAKESVLKALGVGLSRPLNTVPITLGTTMSTTVNDLSLQEYPLCGYCLTIAGRELPHNITFCLR